MLTVAKNMCKEGRALLNIQNVHFFNKLNFKFKTPDNRVVRSLMWVTLSVSTQTALKICHNSQSYWSHSILGVPSSWSSVLTVYPDDGHHPSLMAPVVRCFSVAWDTVFFYVCLRPSFLKIPYGYSSLEPSASPQLFCHTFPPRP